MDNQVKRDRSSSFSQREIETLISLVETKINLIESKKIDGCALRVKEQAWKDIETEFNRLVCGAHHRDAKSLKMKYFKSLKREMRKKANVLLTDSSKASVSTSASTETVFASIEDKVKDMCIQPPEGCNSVDDLDLLHNQETPKSKKPLHKLMDQKIEVVKLQKELLGEELEEKLLKKALLQEELDHRRLMYELERKEMLLKIELLKKKLIDEESCED